MAAEITNSASAIVFGPFHLRPAARLLEKSGEPVRLGGRALDILIALVERPGEVVSHQQLFTRVWPKVQVVEGALRVHMMVLRRALGDGEGGARYVTNIPGRGYCFVAPIFSAGETSGNQDPPRAAPEASPAPMPPTNLPQHLTALIGRSAELAELRELFTESRLVTLVGSGGIGKTRLAIELGWELLRHFPDGIWLIDLAPLSRPELVVIAVAMVLGVTLHKTDMAVEVIAAAIGRQRLLLIFDNCEHLLSAAGTIEALLKQVPGLCVLVTSQERLRIPSETVYRLDPLALPAPAAAEIAGFGAVALFVERARALDRRFTLDAGNAAAVAEICRRLDGIPLALEMAAARLPLLGLEGLRAGLKQRLRMLKAGGPVARARHRTLLGMLDWSFDLLEPRDQEVFRRLAIFAGDFSLDAAITVAGQSEADRWDILDALSRLIDKSLVTLDDGDQPRYRLLETLRLYAADKLSESGETAVIAARHAAHFTELLERAYTDWQTAPDLEWLRLYEPEIDNVRAALDWALREPGRARIAIALAGTAAVLWGRLALLAEGRRYVDQAVELIDPETPTAADARLLFRACVLRANFDRPQALALAERSANLCLQLGDHANRGHALSNIGSIYFFKGRYAEAKEILTEAYEILSSANYKKSLIYTINFLGTLSSQTNEPNAARRWHLAGLALAREVRNTLSENVALAGLAETEFALGNVEQAVWRAREAVAGFRRANLSYFVGRGLINLTSYLLVQGNLTEARQFAEEGLSLAHEAGGVALKGSLEGWAALAALEGRYPEAARLVGFVDAAYAKSGDLRERTEQKTQEIALSLVRSNLSANDIEAYTAEGSAWSEAEAAAFAVDRLISRATITGGTAL